MKTTIPTEPGKSTPNSGARRVTGKSIAPDAVLRKGLQPKGEATKNAEEVSGAARKAIKIQVQGDGGSNSPNGDPKRRGRNFWGVDEPKS
jgi:hypothetical protein